VAKKDCEKLFGRILFACDAGVSSVWRDFLNMVSCVSSSWSSHWVQLGDDAQAILELVKFKMQHMNGVAFTPYTPRPLVGDDFPILVTYTDASRKPDTMEGGYGGFIWLYGSSTVHYFFGLRVILQLRSLVAAVSKCHLTTLVNL
jgi:hypothetical protein